MRVLLDDRPIEVEPATVERAFEVARRAADAEGRVVIEVLGDGRSVADTILENPPADSAGFTELKLVTADVRAFVSVTLSDTAPMLDAAAQAQQMAADEILAGRMEEAIEPLQTAVMAWSLVRDVVDKSSSMLGIDTRVIAIEGSTGAEAIDGLATGLAEIKRAITEQDFSALSDVLAYDMPEHVERWRGLLKAMQEAAVQGEQD